MGCRLENTHYSITKMKFQIGDIVRQPNALSYEIIEIIGDMCRLKHGKDDIYDYSVSTMEKGQWEILKTKHRHIVPLRRKNK